MHACHTVYNPLISFKFSYLVCPLSKLSRKKNRTNLSGLYIAYSTVHINMHTTVVEICTKNNQNVVYSVKNTDLFLKYFLVGVR